MYGLSSMISESRYFSVIPCSALSNFTSGIMPRTTGELQWSHLTMLSCSSNSCVFRKRFTVSLPMAVWLLASVSISILSSPMLFKQAYNGSSKSECFSNRFWSYTRSSLLPSSSDSSFFKLTKMLWIFMMLDTGIVSTTCFTLMLWSKVCFRILRSRSNSFRFIPNVFRMLYLCFEQHSFILYVKSEFRLIYILVWLLRGNSLHLTVRSYSL